MPSLVFFLSFSWVRRQRVVLFHVNMFFLGIGAGVGRKWAFLVRHGRIIIIVIFLFNITISFILIFAFIIFRGRRQGVGIVPQWRRWIVVVFDDPLLSFLLVAAAVVVAAAVLLLLLLDVRSRPSAQRNAGRKDGQGVDHQCHDGATHFDLPAARFVVVVVVHYHKIIAVMFRIATLFNVSSSLLLVIAGTKALVARQ